MCLAYIITWRSKKGIGETCKIQLELFEFYRYLEVVVGTCSASNLFQIDLKVRAFKPLRFSSTLPNLFSHSSFLQFYYYTQTLFKLYFLYTLLLHCIYLLRILY